MADIKINFSSQWPSIQVAKVIASPETTGTTDASPYTKKHKHGLGYPPLAIGMSVASGASTYNSMVGLDVDDTYVYIGSANGAALECAVVYALDISTDFNYPQYDSAVGETLADTSGGQLDLRKFLLHSRAVSPMVLSVKTHAYSKANQDGLKFTYTHPLNYPIFNFGYLHLAQTSGGLRAGIWKNAPLASQAFPWLQTDGYTSNLGSSIINGQYDSNYMWIPGTGDLAADVGSIITLRNPAIITKNTVTVTI